MRKGISLLIALLFSIMALQPAMAAAPAQTYFSFTIDKSEVAKDEPVIARYQLTKPAKRVFITATDVEGGPLAFSFPQTSTMNAQRTAGVITFTVPISAGTLSPLRMTLNVDGQLRGFNSLYVTCDFAWFFEPRVERCPYAPASETPAAIQHFERGTMIWLQATRSIWVLYEWEKQVERYDDAFVDGMAESDPNMAQPPKGLLQPVRGFGLIWRSNPSVMNGLGWAIGKERGYTACTAQAFGGMHNVRTYFTTPEGRVVEATINYEPFAWQVLYVEKLKGCK